MKRFLAGALLLVAAFVLSAATPITQLFGPYSIVDVTKFGNLVPSSSGAAASNRTIIQAAIDYAVNNQYGIVQFPCTNGWINVDTTLWMERQDNRSAAVVSGAANNGSGLIRLTVGSSVNARSTGDIMQVWGVGGTTEANGKWTITVIDGTHVDLQGSTFTNSYTSGGTAYDPKSFGLSLELRGCHQQSGSSVSTTNLLFPFGYNGPYVLVGPGSGMTIRDILIQGNQSAACRVAYPAQSVGVAYSGSNNGAGGTRFLLEGVGVFSAFSLLDIGFGLPALADTTTVHKSTLQDGFYGISTTGQQAWINNIVDSIVSANHIINSFATPPLNVRGGEFGGINTTQKMFSIGSTGALTGSSFPYTIQTTVSSPDSQIAAGCYDRYVINTPDFGPVPFTQSSYAAGVLTLSMWYPWYNANFGDKNINSTTNLSAELQAATKLAAVESNTIFCGGVNVVGAHIEGDVPMTLFDNAYWCASSHPSHLRDIKMDTDGSQTPSGICLNTGAACEAQWLASQTFPFIYTGTEDFTLDDYFSSQPNTFPIDPVTITIGGVSNSYGCYFRRLTFATFVTQFARFPYNDDAEQYNYSRYKGGCEFDRNYWWMQNTGWAPVNANNYSRGYQQSSDLNSPMVGYRPAPWASPILTPNAYANVVGSLGTLGTYPLIHGGTQYTIAKEGDTTPRSTVTSAHQFYSWGQNLTIPWSYLGASNWVNIGQAVTGAANNGSGLIRLTVGSTTGFTTGEKALVNGIQGTFEANGTWTITVIDATHIDLQGSSFATTFTSGGFITDPSMLFPGLGITLNLSGIGDTAFVVTGVYPHLGGITIAYPGTIGTGTDGVTTSPGTKTTVYTGTTIKQAAYAWAYSAAGVALPSCTSSLKGREATVSDASSPTYLGTYSSGGSTETKVLCNGTNWVTR